MMRSGESPLKTRGKWTPKDIRESMELYAVTDDAWLDGRALSDCVEQAIEGGATFMQLRRKGVSTETLVEEARALIPLCREAGIPFVIDDDVEAARLSGADGVHVGQSDTACAAAREALGERAIIGVSAQTVEMALAAQEAGADYLGVGAIVATDTKAEAGVLTPVEVAAIVNAVDIPVVAIGGINASTLYLLEGTGVAGVAVVSAIFAANDIAAAAAELKTAVEQVL